MSEAKIYGQQQLEQSSHWFLRSHEELDSGSRHMLSWLCNLSQADRKICDARMLSISDIAVVCNAATAVKEHDRHSVLGRTL